MPRLVATFLGSSALFAALAALVGAHATRDLDLTVTKALQAVASRPLDLLANADTVIGQSTVTLAIAIAIAFVLWRREPGGTWLAAGFLALTVAGEIALKFALDHPGPPQAFDRSLWNPFGVHIASPSSFPSGHVARVTFLAILIATVARSASVWLFAAAVVAVTLWARVYLGDHWLSDVLGGLALGTAAGTASAIWIARCRAGAWPRP